MQLEPIIPLYPETFDPFGGLETITDKVNELIEEHNKLLEAFKLHRHKYQDHYQNGGYGIAHTDRPD